LGSKLRLLYWVLVVTMALLVFSFLIALHAGAQTTVPTQLSISLPSFTISSGKSTNFTAILMDTNKNPLAGKTINWGATAGSLSAMNGTTNPYGQVSVTYTAPTVDVQTSVMITASFAGDAYYSPSSATSSGIITATDLLQLYPLADAYIDRDTPDSNYGTATTLAWQYTGGFPPDRYRSLLKFDISSIPRSCYIISATLYLYTVTVPPVAYWTGDSFDVLSVSHDTWTENGITWNNAPPFIATIVDRPGGRIPSGAWISNDVTSFVRSEYDIGDTLVSFGIKVNGWDGTLTQANSREAATNHPYLEISIDSTSPTTFHDYDGLWHTSDFTILLSAMDDFSGVAETHYKINEGPIKTVSADGYPRITTESANNTLEYWSIDNAGNEEFPHKVLTGIKLDKTSSLIGVPFRIPEDDVQLDQEVKVSVNVTDSVSGVKYVTLSCLNIYKPVSNSTTVKDLNITLCLYRPTYYYKDPVSGTVTITYPNGTAFRGEFILYILHLTQEVMSTTAGIAIDGFTKFYLSPPVFQFGPGNYTIGMSSLSTTDGYIIESRWQVFPSVQVEAKDDSMIWIDLPMTFNSTTGLYEATIPGQGEDILVRYKITAYDNAGNYRVEDKDGEYHVYTVIPEFTSTIILLLFMIATLAVTVYKRKHSTDYRNSKQQKIYSQIIFAIGTVSLFKGEEKW